MFLRATYWTSGSLDNKVTEKNNNIVNYIALVALKLCAILHVYWVMKELMTKLKTRPSEDKSCRAFNLSLLFGLNLLCTIDDFQVLMRVDKSFL